MELPDLKKLSKLAAACRKAGIKDFEGYGFKFTLADAYSPPSKPKRGRPQALPPVQASETDTTIVTEGWDALSEEEKLLWSVGSSDTGAQ